MHNEQQKQAIAIRVLAIGKRRAPDRFPAYTDRFGNLDRELVNEWAAALGVKTYPLDLWEEAVAHWINHLDHGRMATTGELLKAANHIRTRWETDPRRREFFKQLYEDRQNERERQWREGTLATSRGHQRAIQAPKKPVPDHILNKAKQIAAGKALP